MDQHGFSAPVDGEFRREPRLPDQDSGGQQQQEGGQKRPGQVFLAQIVLADLRQVVCFVTHYIAQVFGPLPVGSGDVVVLPDAGHPDDKEQKSGGTDERVQDTSPGGAAEQVGQPEEAGMEETQSGQSGKHETDGHQPMIEPFAGRITLDHYIWAHCCSSSSSLTSLGPCVT